MASSDFNRRFNVTPDITLSVNPFTNEFTREEVEFYDLSAPYAKDGVQVVLVEPRGPLADYLNKNWRIAEGLKVPALGIDGKLWMSLTFMEIQSAYVPIAEAAGIVGTAGLGLGYFPLRAASNPDVEEVHVYELEPRVIDFFLTRFAHRPEMKKIEVHQGDVRKDAMYDKKKKGPSFDFFWMDVYQTLLPDEVAEDIHLFQDKGSVETYRFWGQEKVVLDSLFAGEHPDMSYLEKAYFKAWKNTPVDPEDESMGVLSDLYDPITDEKYRQAVLAPLGVLPKDYDDEEEVEA
jgi:hypothetical protein